MNRKLLEVACRVHNTMVISAADYVDCLFTSGARGLPLTEWITTEPALYPVKPGRWRAGAAVTDAQLAELTGTVRAPEGTLRVPFSPVLMVGRPPDPAAIAEAIAAGEAAFGHLPPGGHASPDCPAPGYYLKINLLGMGRSTP